MEDDERKEFDEWNEQHGYTDDDYLEFDMDDVVFEDGGVRVNLDNYPELQEEMDILENDQDDDLVDDTIHCLKLHQDAVVSVRFSPIDSSIVASGGCDEIGYITNFSNGDDYESISLEGHTDTLNVEYSPDGQYLATYGLDALIKIWTPDGELLHTLEGASESIESLTWFRKGPLIAAGSGDNLVWLWNASNGQMMGVFAGHESPVISTQFSGDNKKIVSASSNGIKVWNPKDSTSPLVNFNDSVQNFHNLDDEIVTMVSHYDRNIVLSGGLESFVLTNIDSGKVLYKMNIEQGVETCSFNKAFPVFATGSLSGNISIWDTNQLQKRCEMSHDEGVVKIVNFPDSLLFASCSLDFTSRVWDPRSGKEVMKFQGHTQEILDIDISHDANFLATGGDDFTVRIFDLRMEEEL